MTIRYSSMHFCLALASSGGGLVLSCISICTLSAGSKSADKRRVEKWCCSSTHGHEADVVLLFRLDVEGEINERTNRRRKTKDDENLLGTIIHLKHNER